MSKYTTSALLAAIALALAGSATAQEADRRTEAYLTAFGEHTDNVNRTATDETSALIYGAGLGFDINTERRWLEASLQGDVAYLASDEELYESGVLGNVLGELKLMPIPDRVTWFVDGAYGQIPVDERLADTPANRQDFTTVRTGPQFDLPLSQRNLLQFGGSYATTNYSVALDDFDRTEAFLGLRHDINSRHYVAISATTNDTKFEREAEFVDYRQDRALVEWNAIGARTRLLVQAGYDILEREDAEDDFGSTLYNVRVIRKIGQLSTLILQADQQLSDTSSAFTRRLENTGVGGGAVNVSPVAGVFRARSGRIHFRTAAAQLDINVSTSYEEDRYVDSVELRENDRDIIFSSVSVFKTLSPRVILGAFGDLTDAQYIRQDFEYTEWDAGLLASMRLSRTVGLQASAARSKRSGGADEGGFEENVYRLGIYWAAGDAPLDLRDRPGRR